MKQIYLALISSILVTASLSATEMEKEQTSEQNLYRLSFGHPSLKIQINQVKEAIITSNKPAILILGAPNAQSDETRFQDDANFIFFDNSERRQNPQGKPYILGNFNDLECLEKLVAAIGPCFQEIRLDHATYHFTTWSSEHIRLFSMMLKKTEGAFILPPYLQGTILDVTQTLSSKTDTILEQVARINSELISNARNKLPTTYTVPLVVAHESEFYTDEVNNYITLVSPLINYVKSTPETNEDDMADKAIEMGVNIIPSLSSLKKGEDFLREQFASSLKRSEVSRLYYRNYMLPSIVSVFEDFFSDVCIEELNQKNSGLAIKAKNPKEPQVRVN